jgi:Mg-chelatase subunit ChlD
VSIGSLQDDNIEVGSYSPIEELSGKLKFQALDDKLLHSVIEADKKTIEQGKLISDALSQGMGSFTPNLMFEQMVQNFSLAKQIYGERILRQVTGYETEYVERNIRIPEFQRLMQKKLKASLDELKREGILKDDYFISEKGIELASLILYTEELDKLASRGLAGRKERKKADQHGDKEDIKPFSRRESYRNIAVRKSLRTAIRRGHGQLMKEDLKVNVRRSKGHCSIIYALDASGSMKGEKIGSCKKAGIALAYKAIDEEDKVGLIVFGKEVQKAIPPTHDFGLLLSEITRIRASHETDIAATLKEAISLFPEGEDAKHLILITDAVPTKGDAPEKDTLEAVSEAAGAGITISVVGIGLDEKGKKLGEKIVEIGQGKFYVAENPADIDAIVLQDYYSI